MTAAKLEPTRADLVRRLWEAQTEQYDGPAKRLMAEAAQMLEETKCVWCGKADCFSVARPTTTTAPPLEQHEPLGDGVSNGVSAQLLDDLDEMSGAVAVKGKLLLDLTAEIRRLRAAQRGDQPSRPCNGQGGGWQPIATAPRDCNILYVNHPSIRWRGVIGHGHCDDKGVVREDGRCGWRLDPQPTHWRPLPAPPKAALANVAASQEGR